MRMTRARGRRVRVVIESTSGNNASARNKLIPTSRITPRTRHVRYNTIAQTVRINTARTIPPNDGVASRTRRVSSGGVTTAGAITRVVSGGVAASAVVTGGAVALSASGGSELFVGSSLTA